MLVISTSTEALSVALWDGDRLLASVHDVIGRGHAERLLPAIAEVTAGRRAGAIAVDCGPGSFTGVRVGIAAARGLGIAWGVPVAGFSSLPLLAAGAQVEGPFAIAIRGGHGEIFFQMFDGPPLRAMGDARSLRPEAAAALAEDRPVLGTGAAIVTGTARDAWPDARRWPALPAAFRALPPRPLYGRPPDAKRPAGAA